MNFLIMLGAIITDQAAKVWAKRNLDYNVLKIAVPNKLHFIKTVNYGFSNNIMSKNPLFVKLASQAVIILSFIYGVFGLKKSGLVIKAGFYLMLGGGISNLLDRYKDGYVTDFICFGGKNTNKRFLVYNPADFFIFIGSIVYFLGSLFEKDK